MSLRMQRWARLGGVYVAALILQVVVLSDLQAWGAVGDVMLLLAVAGGLVAGPNRGAMYGFAVGLVYDLLLATPFGLSALVYTVVGYASGVVAAWVVEPRRWMQVAVALVAGPLAVVLTVLVARVLGLVYAPDEILHIAVVVAVWNCLLIVPARRLMQWAVGSEEGSDQFWMALP